MPDVVDSMLIMQAIIIFVLLVFFIYLVKFNISLKLTKRIGKYSIEPLTDDQSSLFDRIAILYNKASDSISASIIKSKTLVKYSNRYIKDIDYLDSKKPIDFVSNKILFAVLFLLINILANILEMKFPGIFEIIVVMLIGFYVPDLYNIYSYRLRRKKIEAELLNAIIMLNNAFKSGRSTMQAIEIVKNELSGPIKEEFTKMHIEICYGLSLETVFQRFADRVKIEEINYITSSLTILNRTGGNIVKVFSSIERSMFSKRKLQAELKGLTSSSRAMSKILLALPFAFSGIILLLNPTYFNPFFDNLVGLGIFFTLLVFYCIYAFCVQKVMKVRL